MNNKQFTRRAIRHGEVLLLPVDSIPSDAVPEKAESEIIVAKSESHHHHVAVATGVGLQRFNQGESQFLRVSAKSNIEHRKTGTDAHKTLRLFKGDYQILKKKEFDYTTNLMREVLD